jgi:hypothetical protein
MAVVGEKPMAIDKRAGAGQDGGSPSIPRTEIDVARGVRADRQTTAGYRKPNIPRGPCLLARRGLRRWSRTRERLKREAAAVSLIDRKIGSAPGRRVLVGAAVAGGNGSRSMVGGTAQVRQTTDWGRY